MNRKWLSAVAIMLALSVPATVRSQVAERKGLTLEGARAVIAAAVAEARSLKAPGGAIAVVDEGGNVIAVERLDGTFAAGARISEGKARTAALFKRPTKVFEEAIRKGRVSMTALDDFTPLQGGVPIVVEGQVVGAVGVSGAASAEQDEALALAGAGALAGALPGAAFPVTHIAREAVQDAFARGAVLLGEEAGQNYMIHASRRDGPGQAEIHGLDTDIVHVLEGSATIVTGGEIEDPQTIASSEIRGVGIRRGEERALRAGDVLVVPRGTPHWFKAVQAPFTYYVVKVR